MIIFIDADGTLLNDEKHVPKSAAEAIQSARRNGHRAYLCTGRSREDIFEEIENAGFDGFICDNGALIESDGEVIFDETESEKKFEKSFAIRFLIDRFKIDPSDTIAIGDSKYDLPMFEVCKINIAMGNGKDEIKSAATFVTDSVDEDGILHAFQRLNLI